MLPGVLPSISLASSPIALILFVSRSKATTDGSFNTTPFPLIYTNMLAVPKSIPISVLIISIFAPFVLFVFDIWQLFPGLHRHRNAFNPIFTYTVLLYTKNGIFQRFFWGAARFLKKIRISSFFFICFVYFSFYHHTFITFLLYIVRVLTKASDTADSNSSGNFPDGSIIFHNSCFPDSPRVFGKYSPNASGAAAYARQPHLFLSGQILFIGSSDSQIPDPLPSALPMPAENRCAAHFLRI